MLTFTIDDNNTYIVTANEKFIGRLYKIKGRWFLKYNNVSWGDMGVPYETSLELTLLDLKDDFNKWLTDKDVKDVEYFGELSRNDYKE